MKNIIVILIIAGISLVVIVGGMFIAAFPKKTNYASPTPESSVTVIPPSLNSQSPAPVTKIKLFLIAIEDNGKSGVKVGCGDSLIPIERSIPKTTEPLKAAYEQLLSIKTKIFEETKLYNALYQSELSIRSIKIVSGIAKIDLSGTLQLGGTCDTPRVEQQLRQTAFQFAQVKTTDIKINDVPLSEALSQK
jgi:hypothetical protein